MTQFIPKIKRVAMSGDRRHHNHAAAIVIKNKIICVKRNVSDRNISFILNCLIWPEKIICLNHHAEMNVIHAYASLFLRKAKKTTLANYIRKQKITIVVARFNKHGELKNSIPCTSCNKLMKAIGVKYIIYSDDNGDMVRDSPHNIKTRESSGTCFAKIKY